MNVFENLIDRIQRKLAFGSTKQKTFMHHAKNLLKGEDIDTQIIWRGLEGAEGQQNAQLYCQLIFNDFYSGEIKQKNNLMFEEQILATLLPLRFYKVKWDKKFALNEQTVKQTRVSAHSKWIVCFFEENQKWNFFSIINRFVFAPVQQQSKSFMADQIMSQMKQCEQYCKMVRQRKQTLEHNYKKLKLVSYPKSSELESRALTYGYVCLIDYIKDRNSSLTQEQFYHLKNLISSYLFASEERIMECLQILLHLLKSFIIFYGCPYEKILKQFLVLSNQIRAMPEDIGRVGEQLFHRFLKELKIPGYSFRRKLIETLPDLQCKQSLFSIKQQYLITNSMNFTHQKEKINLSILRKKVVFHLMKVSGFLSKQLKIAGQFLNNIKEEEIYNVYSKAMKICQVSYAVEGFQQAKKILKESLEKLMIVETKPNENRKILNAQQSLLKEISPKNKRQHPLCLFQLPNISITHVPLSQFLESKSNKNLQALIKKSNGQLAMKTYFCSKNKISFIFYGNSLQFFKFIQPLGKHLQYRSVDKLTGFKIYYLPKKNKFRQNYLSDYLGCFDILYQRTIINCFGERAIYPWVEPKQKNKNLLPIQLMNKNLNCYLKEADNTFHINLFKCTVGKIGLNYNKFQESYYFCESVNIGLFAEAETIKANKFMESNKQKYNSRELPDIISHKLKQFEPLAVLIQMQKYQRFQNKTSFHKQKMIMVEDIQICNLPKWYFLGKKPKPNSSSLEVSILPSSSAKLFRKELMNSYNFKQKRQNFEIVEAFKDLFIECTVKSIRIQNLKKQTGMKVIIDGQVLEGVDHIQIQAAISIDKRVLTLPIQTFLPIT